MTTKSKGKGEIVGVGGSQNQKSRGGKQQQKCGGNSESIPASNSSISGPPQKNISSNMKGPAVSTPLEARNLVRDYMLQQNRPYSAIQIHDNLHGRVAKPQLQRGTHPHSPLSISYR